MGENNDEPRPGFDYFVTHKGQGNYYDTEFNFNGEKRQVVKGYHDGGDRHRAGLVEARPRQQAVDAHPRPQGDP
jgi:hypothetical protein